jgi:hypothetical protein
MTRHNMHDRAAQGSRIGQVADVVIAGMVNAG